MSADSTELTFVRCPSCRSLVPAMSKSCRMCGATLDASGKSEEVDPSQRRSGRVRQRTMSQGQDELSAAVNKIREEMGSIPETPVAVPSSGAAKTAAPSRAVEPPAEDPLSAFVEEVEVPDAEAGHVSNGSGEESGSVDEKELEAFLSGDKQQKNTAPVELSAPAEEAPRVVVESGRGGKKGGLSFAKGQKERDEPRQESRPVRDERVSERRDSERHERREESPRTERHDARPPQGGADKSQWTEIPKRNASGGKLCGWFVSFRGDGDGRSIELREGKYFVSSRQIRGNDLVIDDRSVSSPHAMLALAGDNKMKLQDLMSDKGVFVRRHDDSDYHQLSEGSAEVYHGDWVKFGEVEFQVCLVAHVGEK